MRKRRFWISLGSNFVQTLIVLIGITFITFFILQLSPKNPAEIWLVGTDGNAGQISQEAIHEQEVIMGLDKPMIVQYGNWILNLLHGDMGVSFTTKKPVIEELSSKIGPTILLAFISLLITLIISVPLGIYCAYYKDKIVDNIVRMFSFIGISLPSFLISLILLWLFCLKLKIFPIISGTSLKGMILPAAVFILQCSSKLTRQVRAVVLEQLDKDYVKGAIARGVGRSGILFSHVLKNVMVPILTWVSIYLGVLLGGAAIVETIFSWDGIGKLAVESVARLDYYVIQGFVLWIAIIFLVLNFVVDVLCGIIDPRVKRG